MYCPVPLPNPARRPSAVGVDTNSIRNIDLGEKLLPDSFE